MTTLEMEIALMRHLNIRQNLIVPNVHWGITGLHECDLLSLSAAGYATEIEIKVDKGDLLKDKDKLHGHVSNRIKYLYFAVPSELTELALQEIPSRAGLLMVYNPVQSGAAKVVKIKEAQPNSNARKWSEDDRFRLARLGAIRILGLKQKIWKQVSNK